MKIIIVGGTGMIGQAVCKELQDQHELVIVGHSSGDHQVDISSLQSIKDLFTNIGQFDALVVTTGKVSVKPLTDMSDEDFRLGINNKLMGQINLVLEGLKTINDNGSFTLTSGILSDVPIASCSSAAMVNGGLNSFVHVSAIEMPRNIRINIVSPTILTESQSLEKYANLFEGHDSVPAKTVAQTYRKSVEGTDTGQIYRVQ